MGYPGLDGAVMVALGPILATASSMDVTAQILSQRVADAAGVQPSAALQAAAAASIAASAAQRQCSLAALASQPAWGACAPPSAAPGWPAAPPAAPQCSPTQIDALVAEAGAAYARGDFPAVLRTCEAAYASGGGLRADVLLLLGAAHCKQGAWAAAAAYSDAAILLDPGLAPAHATLANAMQSMGQLDVALVYFQSALRLQPSAAAYVSLGSVLVARGAPAQAADAFSAALALDPGAVDAHTGLGDLWRTQGGVPGRSAAARCYREALSRHPGHAPAWRGLGDLHREANEAVQALPCYQEAVRLAPALAEVHAGLGAVLRALCRAAEAEAPLAAVVALRPGCALALATLGGAYYEAGRLEPAIQAYRSALAAQPNFCEAWNNLGNSLREAGRLDEAVGCYSACVQLQLTSPAPVPPGGAVPGSAAAASAATTAAARLAVTYNNLGGVLKLQGRGLECAAAYERVAALQPASPEAAANLGSAYKDYGRHDEAVAAYRRSLVLRPDFPEAFANLVHSMQCVCDWTDRPALFARLEAEARRDIACGRLPSVQPFHAMAYPFPADLARAISARYAEYCLSNAARLGVPRLVHPPAARLAPGQRLRVAYVSSDFGNHPLSHLMGSVFGLHDRSRYEVHCYALSADDGSEWRRRIASEAEHFVDVSAWGAGDIAARISADGVHVALNLNGYTKGARNEIFALQPAPVQASYMGFPATAGAPYLPWIVLDKAVCPGATERACYSEAGVALMPHSYFVNDYLHSNVADLVGGGATASTSRAGLGLPDGAVVYSCSNQLYKYDPETFETWCRVLHRVPGSVLWLLRFPPAGERRVHAEAAARGIDPARVIFTDVAAKPEHIARSGLADVFLDTPHCNAHTTCCDVLWAGVPVVTLPLTRCAGRVAASLCAATGLGAHMVVRSLAEYEERAVELGLDSARREALRAALLARRATCPLFDTRRWVRDFERVLSRMWDIHCEGGGARDFEVRPDEDRG